MKFLIAGLGNPGEDYSQTRHNAGFMAADALSVALAKGDSISFATARYGAMAEIKFRGKTVFLLKPSTFMNLSGQAVKYWLDKENISLNHLLVITDDIAIPFGTLRLRPKGGDGGHNGLTSIIASCGSPGFARLRFGIGSEFQRGGQSDFVLGQFSDEEEKAMPALLEKTCEIVKSYLIAGLDQTMTRYNKS